MLAAIRKPREILLKRSDNSSIKNKAKVDIILGTPMTITSKSIECLPKTKDLLLSMNLSSKKDSDIVTNKLTPIEILDTKLDRLESIRKVASN